MPFKFAFFRTSVFFLLQWIKKFLSQLKVNKPAASRANIPLHDHRVLLGHRRAVSELRRRSVVAAPALAGHFDHLLRAMSDPDRTGVGRGERGAQSGG